MKMKPPRGRIYAATIAAAALAVTAAGCASSDRSDSGDSSGTDEAATGTFVFAGSAEPATLDPFYASDGESFRPARQIFEGLVGTKPGTADPAPLLATSWTQSEDGLSYDFKLRTGVSFSDSTPFNADAVCYNFDRWYNTPPGIAQSDNLSYYWGVLFHGFATGPDTDSVYKSCEVNGDDEVTISLTAPFAGFVSALSLPSFSMQSPTALEKYPSTKGDPRQGPYAQEHPTGTGPFLFESWEHGKQVTLTRNEDYWGEKAHFATAVIIAIDDPKARAQALLNGEIDGYDLVGPADIPTLEEAGYQVVDRPAFNVLYLGITQTTKPLDDIRVRQAIAYAIDKEAVINSSLPEGTTAAIEFMPDLVNGYTEDVPKYEYDPEKAKALLAEAGQENMTVEFNYPTDVSRPYMPSPEDTFNAIRSQLEAVGITVKPVADQWDPDYLDRIDGTSDHGIYLLGWTGDYNDPDNFIGVFFGSEQDAWGFKNEKIFGDLAQARGLKTVEEQKPVYEQINKEIMEFVPGVPLASPVPSLGFSPDVQGYQASPVQDEPWNTFTIG